MALQEAKNALLDRLKELSSGHSIYIVGAGKYGDVFGRWLDLHNIAWCGYVDKAEAGKQLNSKQIYAYNDDFGEKAFFLISSFLYRSEMATQLIEQGIPEERMIQISKNDLFYEIFEELVPFRKQLDRIKMFHNRHQGERCFIIGNGPSLRIEDLERLKDEVTFACNSIYAVYGSTFWRPVYYCAWDSIFFRGTSKEKMKTILSESKASFTSAMQIKEDDPHPETVFFLQTISPEYDRRGTELPRFSTDCNEGIYISGTITYGMLQLAAYMGFQTIYLLGVDCTFSVERDRNGQIKLQDVQNHMDQIEAEEENYYVRIAKRYGHTYLAEIDLQMDGYKAARRYAEEHGVKIYNATRGGKLEVFERVDFDSIFAK